jgi:hypothetical protein
MSNPLPDDPISNKPARAAVARAESVTTAVTVPVLETDPHVGTFDSVTMIDAAGT